MKNFSLEEENQILELLVRYKGDHERVGQKVGAAKRSVMAVDMRRNGTFNYTPEGRGPKLMQKYIVATRDCNKSSWEKTDAIAEARRRYDEGEVELAQGRDGFNFILYAIPRRQVDITRKPYFSKPTLELVA